ncbi:Uncharacterised protein [Dorea longicatena]|uniref:T-Q ester bond containing domain-containing protein n=1 Tax=Dorea longicatena TaxID=88431 RepID=A0A174KN00_9FIRM|nr:Uncharacterised protein [Dorea longicatena]
MNIHLITYLTSKLFWIYTVFRYNTILYPKNEDTQKLFAYFCAYLLSCWGSMQWGTMYGDLIFELIALLIITVAYQADWQHHVWNTLMVYIMGILCDGIPIVFFQRYAVARNPVHHHMGPGTIVMGNFIFFLLEVIIERKVGVKRSYYIKNRHWLAMLTERKISIHTTATDKNGKKEIEAGKDLTIVDTVTLEGLEIGTKYKLSGWQMIKEENAKLIIDGKEVTNDYEFTADKENMEVQIEFTFDGNTLGGKQLVTFEELYDMTNPEEPKKVTEHKDINDEGQTVTIKEVPETSTPETPGTTTKTSNPPKTGDTANAALWIAILVLSAAGITGVRIWNKKKQVKRLGIEEKKEEKE